MNESTGRASSHTADRAAASVPQYVTSRDAAALLGVPEPQVRELIRDGTLAGFHASGYWIASGAAVARYADSAEGALARLRTDFPGWRIGALSWRYFAIADAGPAPQAIVFTARTVEGLRHKLDDWHAAHAPAPRNRTAATARHRCAGHTARARGGNPEPSR